MQNKNESIKKMRVLFIGSAISSKVLLKKCLDLKLNIVGICTSKKSVNYDFCDLKKEFKNSKIPTKYVNNINDFNSYKWIKQKKPDVILCFGWSQILRQKIINLSSKYVIGFHPSELPKNKGRHPIIWSLALGLKKTASSFFVIKNPKPDSGDIISQKIVHIKKNYNAEILYKKIMDVAKNQIKEIMEKIENNEKIKLKKNFKSNYWRKRTNLDGKIDWRMSAKLIHNLVRALDKPYMHPHFTNDNFEFKIIKSKIISNYDNYKNCNFEPGKILSKHNSYFDVKCGEGIIRILKTDKKIKLNNTSYL